MLETTVIRLLDGRLVWYPPGIDQAPREIDSEELDQQLQELAKAPRARLCFAVPATDVTLVEVEFTADEKKHIGKSLPFMLEEQLASNVEELHFSTLLKDRTTLCAAICSDQNMQQWRDLLAPISGVNRWTPEPLLLPWSSGEWSLVLEERYAIVRTGSCSGFSIERDFLPDMLQAALLETAAPQRVVVYGQDQAQDTELIPQVLHNSVQWRRGDLRAAMLLNSEDNAQLNLLQGNYAPRLPLDRWWQQWRLVAGFFAAAIFLQLIADYTNYLSLSRENLSLRQEIEASARRVIPRGALQKPEVQIKRKLDALRGTTQSSGFIGLMSRVGEIVADTPDTGIASISYNGKGGEMRMNITATDFEAVEVIRNAMTKNGLDAIMENSSVQGDRVRARLKVGAGS